MDGSRKLPQTAHGRSQFDPRVPHRHARDSQIFHSGPSLRAVNVETKLDFVWAKLYMIILFISITRQCNNYIQYLLNCGLLP